MENITGKKQSIMPYHICQFRGQADLQRMAELVYTDPDYHLHVVDLDYRLCSWALQNFANVTLWEDEAGEVGGWAAAQRPFAALDYVIRPDALELEDQVLLWGTQRWQAIADESRQQRYCFLSLRSDQPGRFAHLAEYSFQADDWRLLHMTRPAADPVLDAHLMDGFSIRPLAGQSEVADYTALHRAAFDSENMTEDWRTRILKSTAHVPDLDLVAVAPDGRLAAFCIGWLRDLNGKRLAQIEPVGVHPDFQGHGLGRAILTEELRQMQAHSVDSIFIEAESNNGASQSLYQTMGFRVAYETAAHSQVFQPQAGIRSGSILA